VAAGAVDRARRGSIETTLFKVETAVLEHVGLTRRVDDEAAGAVTARQLTGRPGQKGTEAVRLRQTTDTILGISLEPPYVG